MMFKQLNTNIAVVLFIAMQHEYSAKTKVELESAED